MTCRLAAVVLAAADPAGLARFWARALRWETRPAGGGAVALAGADGTSFEVLLVPAEVAKSGQNRIHFDLTTTSARDQTVTVAELLAAGAAHADVGQGDDGDHVVLADPDGNELCVLAPGNRFLAGCPRLGAVNCDGSRALGEFYSAALGWPLVWDHAEETAVQHPSRTGPKVTWSGPPLMPRLPYDRLHLHLAPATGTTAADALAHLTWLGASVVDGGCAATVGLVDVDGNRCCLVDPERAARC